MSAPQPVAAPVNGTSNSARPELELDIPKLHSLPSEQQDLYLLTFVSDLLRHVTSLSKEELSTEQSILKKELLKVLTLSSPPPSRVIRTNLGKAFADIFGRGSRSLLYETINELLGIINAAKGEKELKTKHAAAHSLGDIFAAGGDSAISLSGLTCSSLIRLLKTAQNHAGLRSTIYKALGKVVTGIDSSIDEAAARDIWKQARSAASGDKAFIVQTSACRCLEQLIKLTPYFDNSNDFDSLKSTIWKAIESSVVIVRHAAASCLAAILVKSYSENTIRDPVPKPRKPKKTGKKPTLGEEEDEEISRPGSPSPRKPAVQLALSLSDILRVLSTQYGRSSTANKARAGIAVCYRYVMNSLNDKIIEDHYSQIADHLFYELLSHPTIIYNRYRLLMTRKFVKVILEDTIGNQLLGESSQINAARWLINDILKNYPQVIQERREPNKYVLTGALSALSALISSLGSAVSILADSCREALLQVLPHPSYTVQIHTSHCLRTFVLACPQQLLSCVTICMNSLKRELDQLSAPRHFPRRCVGYANGLAAMLSTSRLQPLYGSVDVYSRVLTQATELLKISSSSELRVSATQIQVAWILIGGLMPLGPSFVKIHLPQLLLLWRNALPRPLARDNIAQRDPLEMSFLSHVRECALGSILVFLEFNSKLVTTDGSKRIASMLQNTIMFLDSLPTHKSEQELPQRLSPSLQLHDFAIMVRRRVLQCFSKLVNLSHLEHAEVLSQSNLLSLAISSFADIEIAAPKSVETSIANSASNFESIWDLGDNWGSGVTGLVRGFEVQTLPGERVQESLQNIAATGIQNVEIDGMLLSPSCPAKEHDSVRLYSSRNITDESSTDPSATEVVNAAIDLFAIALPLQASKVQESSLEQIATLLSAHTLQRNPARRAAMTVNIATALVSTLKVAVNETECAPGNLKSTATEKIMAELVRRFVIDPDPFVRNVGCEALGRLCNSSGNAFTSSEINHLIDTIVANRDPSARAGCAVALGCIHSQVGSMAAGFHLKTIVGVLLSLCNDPHPIVHFWALEGLARVADSAGLTFSVYVSSTLGMLAQLYAADSHNEEAALLATSNIEAEFSTPVAISRCVDSLVNVLGPDLQDMSKARSLIFTLVRYFQLEEQPALLIEGTRCLEHLSLYAPGHMEFARYLRGLQGDLVSTNPRIRDVAIQGLNNLMKRDADEIIKTATPGLEDELWLALDQLPGHPGIQNIIKNWLQQTALLDTNSWVQRCQNVLAKTRTKPEEQAPPTTVKTTAAPELQDEEVAGFAAAAAGATQGETGDDPAVGQELLKWQTRSFAMGCLSELLSLVSDAILPDQTIPGEAALQHRIGDVVRTAFSASTANVVELRIWGLKMIDQVLKMFGKTPDPDFSEASLLEQYQAQIGSALTPAFAIDSSPELASEAINVCASFVATGIVTNVDRMGRIFKLLVTALESSAADSETTAIGDLKGLSSNARVMVKMAVFSAWAQLQIASSEQDYLVPIIQPYTAMLTPLWLASLQEFARLKFEPEISSTLGSVSTTGNLDEIYAALNRETLLKFYQDSWLNLVDAIASLVERDSDFVFDALDGKLEQSEQEGEKVQDRANGVKSKGDNINYREEPVAFFFVLFGLAFEALVGQNSSPAQTLEILQALKKILRPAVSGNAIYQDTVFSETMDTLDRLALTKGFNVQTTIVEIARNLSLDHLSAKGEQSRDENLSDDIEQLFELTRIIILILAGLLPNFGESSNLHVRPNLSDDAVNLIHLSLESLVSVAEVFPSIIRADLHACILHIFCTILATGICQLSVVPQALPIFKHFIQSITTPSSEDNPTISLQIRGCLTRFLTTLSNAQRRETETALPCAKNTLLAITILLTSGGHVISPQDPLISKSLGEMLDCLQDLGLAKVAANCIRSLLLAPSTSPTDEAIPRFLFPRLLLVVTDPSMDDPENARSLITHTLTSSLPTLSRRGAGISAAMAMVVPALLCRANREGEKSYGELAARLLEVAGADQMAFRAIVRQMEQNQRAFLEEILRSSGGGRREADGRNEGDRDEAGKEPSIALRMDF